jgi:glyoxylase I family protein
MLDEHFDGPWRDLFRARSERVRAIFLGDPAEPYAGIVELVVMDGGADNARPAGPMQHGFGWLSFWVDLDATLARLRHLHRDRDLVVIETNGNRLATLLDPDDIRIELLSCVAIT